MSVTAMCPHCRGRILWLIATSGEYVAVNERPDPQRGYVVRLGPDCTIVGRVQAEALRGAGQRLYLPHSASCERFQTAAVPPRPQRTRLLRVVT